MLILTRKSSEIIVIGNDIQIIVCDIIQSHVKLGINAPSYIDVHRYEVYQRILKERESLHG